MRKTTFVKPLSWRINLFCLVALGMICRPAFAQDSTSASAPAATPAAAPAKEAPTATALPTEPKELLLLAAKTNGLCGDDVKPWHLKVTYKSFDQLGDITDQGTYEEFWVSPKKFKRIFTGKAFAQTEYGTEKGIMVSGEQNSIGSSMTQLRGELVGPMPSPESIQRMSVDLKQKEIADSKFDCLSQITSAGIHFGTTWCLDTLKPILLITAPQQGAQIVHNSIGRFQDRYIAQDLMFVQESKTVFDAHLDSIEVLKTIDEALFLPPADATPKRITVTIAGGVMVGMLLKKVPPEYPLYAKEVGITGTVVLQATINKDGRIANLHVMSGPPELQQASLDAVKHWVYRPYLLNGEPVEVMTTINVVFTLGNHPGGRY
jgi:TonB family protein